MSYKIFKTYTCDKTGDTQTVDGGRPEGWLSVEINTMIGNAPLVDMNNYEFHFSKKALSESSEKDLVSFAIEVVDSRKIT